MDEVDKRLERLERAVAHLASYVDSLVWRICSEEERISVNVKDEISKIIEGD